MCNQGSSTTPALQAATIRCNTSFPNEIGASAEGDFRCLGRAHPAPEKLMSQLHCEFHGPTCGSVMCWRSHCSRAEATTGPRRGESANSAGFLGDVDRIEGAGSRRTARLGAMALPVLDVAD
jgi:hypothetical protein